MGVIGMEDITVQSEDQASIATYLLPGGTLAVILCHGKAFDRDSFVDYGQALHAQGYTVAILNFRGYGRSTVGTQGPDAIAYDVLAVAGMLKARGHECVALGASRGGGGVLRAVALNPESFRGVITWSTVAVDDAVAQKLGHVPKLFIVSEKEMMHEQTMAVYHKSPDPKWLKEIPGGRHAQKIWQGPDRDMIEQDVRMFLKSL